MPVLSGLLQTCLETALVAACGIAIFEGARRLAGVGFGRLAALMLAIGLLLPVFEGGASLRYAAGVQLLAHEMPAMNANEPPGGWEKAALTPQERTARSTNAAQLNFLLSGKLMPFIDANGQRVAFAPSQQDLLDHDGLVRGQKGAEDVASQFQDRGVRLLAGAAAFLVLGLLTGWVQRRRPAGADRR